MKNKSENILPCGFNGIWLDRDIILQNELNLNEKIILSIIKSFTQSHNECFATNKFFSMVLNLSTKRVSEIISSLNARGYIHSQIVYKGNTKAFEKRILTLNEAKITPLYPEEKGYPPPTVRDTPPYSSGYPPPTDTEDIINNKNKIYKKPYKNNKWSNSTNLTECSLSEEESIAYKSIEYFMNIYKQCTGKDHPYLKKEQMNRVKETLLSYINDYNLELEDMELIISAFFDYPPKYSDGNINLFITKSVFIISGYSAGLILEYEDY